MPGRKWSFESEVARFRKHEEFWTSHRQYDRASVQKEMSLKGATPQWIAHVLAEAGMRCAIQGVLGIVSGDATGWAFIDRAWRYKSLDCFVHQQRYDQLHAAWLKTDRTERIRIGRIGHTDLIDGGMTWSLAVAIEQDRFADAWGDRLLRSFAHPDDGLLDGRFWIDAQFGLHAVRLHALRRGCEWTYAGELPEDWPVYDAVFRNWDNDRKFAKAVHDLCEYHVTHCSDTDGSTLFGSYNPVFPGEILALRHVRREMSLSFPEIEHPLVRGNPLWNLPAPLPRFESDELLDNVLAFLRRTMPDLEVPWEDIPGTPVVPEPVRPKRQPASEPAARKLVPSRATKKSRARRAIAKRTARSAAPNAKAPTASSVASKKKASGKATKKVPKKASPRKAAKKPGVKKAAKKAPARKATAKKTAVKKPAAKRARPKTPSRKPEKLIELAALLLPGEEGLQEEIRLAASDPDAYAKAFPKRMYLRRMDGDEPTFPWLALLDGLIDRKQLAEFDWREDPPDLVDQLEPLLKPHSRSGLDFLENHDDWEETPADELLQLIAKNIRQHRIVLLGLDSGGDSYPVMVRPESIVPEAKRLAREAGYERAFAWE